MPDLDDERFDREPIPWHTHYDQRAPGTDTAAPTVDITMPAALFAPFEAWLTQHAHSAVALKLDPDVSQTVYLVVANPAADHTHERVDGLPTVVDHDGVKHAICRHCDQEILCQPGQDQWVIDEGKSRLAPLPCELCGLRGTHRHRPHCMELHGVGEIGLAMRLTLAACIACGEHPDDPAEALCPALLDFSAPPIQEEDAA